MSKSVKKSRTGRKKDDVLPDIQMLIVTNMEPIRLQVCWSRKQDFQNADMFAFLRFSQDLPPVDVELVEEFVHNYDVLDGVSTVKGREIVIDELVVSQALWLPTSEIGVTGPMSDDFVPSKYFKTGEDAFEKNQGWKTAEALTPELIEWSRFAQKRLMLSRHSTYLMRKLLYAVVQTLEGMVFNWATFVASRIQAELVGKRKTGKIASLLCSNYISELIKHQLKAPQQEQPTPVPYSVPVVEPQQKKRRANPSISRPILEEPSQPVPVQPIAECAHVASSSADIKQQLLVQLSQFQLTVNRLAVGPTVADELKKSRKTVRHLEDKVRAITTELGAKNQQLQAQLVEQEKEWGQERQLWKEVESMRKEEYRGVQEKQEREKQLAAQLLLQKEQSLLLLQQQLDVVQAEAEVLQARILELVKERPQCEETSTSSEDLQGTIRAQDQRIRMLESQVRELGADNEALSAQLCQAPDEEDESEEEVPPRPRCINFKGRERFNIEEFNSEPVPEPVCEPVPSEPVQDPVP